MILIKDNVEKIAEGKKAELLKSQGFVPLEGTTEIESKSDSDPSERDFSSMKVQELRSYAKERGIPGANALTRSELLELLG